MPRVFPVVIEPRVSFRRGELYTQWLPNDHDAGTVSNSIYIAI